MKKFLRTGKKTLSVFLAVLMAFTALVFAAPQKAVAVNAGKYYVRVTCYNDNPKDAKGSYTAPWQDSAGGYSVNGNYSKAKNTNGRKSYNSGGGYTIFFNKADGTESYVTKDLETFIQKDYDNKGKTESFVTACEGFPTKIQYYNCESDGFSMVISEWHIQKIEVASSSDMTDAKILWSGNFGVDSKASAYIGYIYLDSDGKTKLSKPKGGTTGSWETVTNSGYDSKWETPVPTSINWVSASENNLTISTGSNAVNRAFKFNILDQYGVVMSTSALHAANAEPTVSVTATNFAGGTVSTENSANLYYTFADGTGNYTATVYAKPALKSLTKGINSYEVTVYVSVPGTGIGESKTFTIYDPKYTVFFDANGGNALAPASTQVYYGESLASQAALDGTSNYPTGGTYAGHSWLGLFDASSGGNAMDPNAAVTASKTYYAQWDENTYVVVFLDKEGKSVDIQYVPYGGNADGAAAAAKLGKAKSTADKHFTFKSWDQNVNGVSANMIVKAVYEEAAHTFDSGVDVAANCQHGAGKEYTCTVCDYKKVVTTSSVLGGHTLTGLIQDVAPTCTEEGKGHKECTVCGAIVEADTAIPALGHSYKIEVNPEATCAAEGERSLTCTRCGVATTEAIPKIQHSYVVKSHVDATCDLSSYDVMECSVCKDTYNMYLGAASNEHTWSESYNSATGILTLTCSVCGTVKTVDIGANIENFTIATVTTQPTCKEDGVVTVTAGSSSYTVKISKENIPHSFETEVTPATCTADGKIVNVCTVCGYRDETNAKTISKLGHDLAETITTPATCTAVGVKTISCKRDGCTYSTTENISATGHKKSAVVLDCTSGGKIKCAVCGEEIADIPAREHTYTGAVRTVPATCSTNGIKYTKCAYCNAEKAELTDKLSHTYGEWEVMVPAKCGAQGVQKRTCVCGAYETEIIPALTHDIYIAEESYATCTQAGVRVEKCTRLGCDYEDTTVTQPTGHALDSGVVHAQTCTSGKYTIYTCMNIDANTGVKCDYQSFELATGDEGKALGHDFSVEKSTTPATCETDGSKVMKCSRCEETETTVIPKLGHNFVAESTVAATCTTSGYTVMKCNNAGCTKTYNEYNASKPALGHLWGAWTITTPSTNTQVGSMTRSCTRDGCTATETVEIPAGGHSFEGAVGEVVVAATCHSEGVTKYTCTAHVDADGNNTCGVSINVTAAKTPHKLYTSVTYPKCERKFNEDGTYTDTFTPGEVKVYCTNSGCTYVDETASFVLAAPSDHNWGDYQTLTEPTCAAPGKDVRYCKNCGTADYVEIPATGNHNFIPTVVAPTCEERGYTIYACQGCGLTYRDDYVAALGHDLDDGVVVEATCTTPGGILYTCKRVFQTEKMVDGEKVYVDVPCGYTKFVEDPEKPAFGHNLSEWKFVEHPSEPDAYAKWRECMNAGCTYSEYEKGAGTDHEAADGVNVYYKVNYYNEWVTDTFETITTNKLNQKPPMKYTQLADTFKTQQLASIFVLKNTEAVYPGKSNPRRDKTRDYGDYTFEGWTELKGQDPYEVLLVGETHTVLNPIPDGVIADTSKITKNTDLYAFFRCREVYYDVTFFNGDGRQLTVIEKVLHGHSAEYPDYLVTPTRPEDNYYKYEFKGWSYNWSQIYETVGVFAEFDQIRKKYVLVYHDWDGSELGREEITYGGVAQNEPTVKGRAEDNTYIYTFLNKWVLQNGVEVDLKNFTGIYDGAKEGTEIHVFAKYAQRKKVYIINFGVLDPFGQNLGDAKIQITNSKGQLIASGTTDIDGNASINVDYSSVYGLTISRGNYWIEGTFTLDPFNPGTIAAAKVAGKNNTYQILVQLNNNTDNPDSPEDRKCKCICHSFVGGLWITILNLLYRVFKIKHVCCYDMFVVHGDKIIYKS